MKVYRFEYTHNNNRCGQGLFQGLYDALDEPLGPMRAFGLLQPFSALCCPDVVDEVNGATIVFWFTEDGLKQFASEIQRIVETVRECAPSWDVVVSINEICEEEIGAAIYRDEDQVAWDYVTQHGLPALKDDYRPFAAVNELLPGKPA